MAADSVVVGIEDLTAKLRAIPDALRQRVLRNALAAGARLVRDAARAAAPVLSRPVPYRTSGLVRDSIVVRTSKIAKRAGDVGVFVNVRPAKGAKYARARRNSAGRRVGAARLVRASDRGARSPRDPYYWRFLEFGTRKMRARPFLQVGARQIRAALPIVESAVEKWVYKTNASGMVIP